MEEDNNNSSDFVKKRKLSLKPDQEVIQAFRLFDQDNDGRIRSGEVTHLVQSMGGHVDCSHVQELIRASDKESSGGGLDLEQFMKHWSTFKAKGISIFRYIDD